MKRGELTKLVVDLPEGDQASAETLWAEYLRPRQFRLKNVPIWAYGLAYEDIVEGVMDIADGRTHFTRVVECSGLLTVRAAGPNASPILFRKLIQALQSRAVATEHFSASYSAFAMSKEEFDGLLPTIEEAEQSDEILVEIANDQECGD